MDLLEKFQKVLDGEIPDEELTNEELNILATSVFDKVAKIKEQKAYNNFLANLFKEI